MARTESAMTITTNTNETRKREISEHNEARAGRQRRLGDVLYMIAAAEFAVIFFAVIFTVSAYYLVFLRADLAPSLYIPSAAVIAGLVVVFSAGFRHYVKLQSQRKRWYVTVGIGSVILSFSIFLTLLFLLKATDAYSRGAFFCQFFVAAIAIVGMRSLTHNNFRAAIARNAIEARRVVLIGRRDHCVQFASRIVKAGLRIQAVIPFPPVATTVSDKVSEDGEAFREIVRQCRPLCPDDILMLATEQDLPNTELLAGALSELPVSLHMIPVALQDIIATAKFSELGLLPTIQLLDQPLSPFDRFIKRTFDFVVSLIGLMIFSPLLALVALAIKLESPGPAIFRQSRHGFNNEVIKVFKFRTMRTVEDGTNFTQAVKNDPRVTPFGNILRRTNIDELPQLINVLLGEMSLVGPRPHPIALNLKFENKLSPLFRRHNVKPGITGWAQVNGCRGETNTLDKMQKRLHFDLYYIDHWSFFFDIQIIMMTLVSRKAYLNAY